MTDGNEKPSDVTGIEKKGDVRFAVEAEKDASPVRLTIVVPSQLNLGLECCAGIVSGKNKTQFVIEAIVEKMERMGFDPTRPFIITQVNDR